MTSMTYPNGRVSITIMRADWTPISRLTDQRHQRHVGELQVLGLGTIVEMTIPTNVNLTPFSQTGGTGDAGTSTLASIVWPRGDQNWYNTDELDRRFQYGYDRDSNVLWMNNTLSANSEPVRLQRPQRIDQLQTRHAQRDQDRHYRHACCG